jgi:DNA-binding PadR family transcriptional regulator
VVLTPFSAVAVPITPLQLIVSGSAHYYITVVNTGTGVALSPARPVPSRETARGERRQPLDRLRVLLQNRTAMKQKDYLLGQFELMAMLAVLQRGNEAYGLQIQAELKQGIGREYAVGQIYTTLARLEERKFVKSRLGDQESDRLGRPRRYFTVTGAGIEAINDAQEALRKLTSGIKALKPAFDLPR